jgi:hypothetical protein
VAVAEQFIEEAEITSYARRGHSSADSDMRLQAGYQTCFPQQIPPTQGNAVPKRQLKN